MIPEVRAKQLLDDYEVKALPVDPFYLAKRAEAEVVHVDMQNFCDGFLMVQSGKIRIGLNSAITSEKRKNYTLAHELGHLCMDVSGEPNQKIECASTGIESYSKNLIPIEIRANRFASELLLPKHLVGDLIEQKALGWSSVAEVGDIANVSLTATARKFMQLTDEACSLVVSENGYIKWFESSPSFNLRFDMTGRLIHADTFAASAFKSMVIPNEFTDIAASAWVENTFTQVNSGKLQEWTLALNSYGQVLTLLWDDLGIGDEDNEANNTADEESESFDPAYGWETPSFGKKKR